MWLEVACFVKSQLRQGALIRWVCVEAVGCCQGWCVALGATTPFTGHNLFMDQLCPQ